MGSLSPVLPLKRDKSSPRDEKMNSYSQRPRSRLSGFMILKKIDYLQWISALAVFIFFMFLFQLFLPLSRPDGDFLKQRADDLIDQDLKILLEEIGGLDFGQDVPTKLLMKFQREKVDKISYNGSRTVMRFGSRNPKLALVFADLLDDPQQILMVTVAAALKAIGYEFEVYSLEDGPIHSVWKTIGVPISIVDRARIMINWLNYDGVLVNSLAAKDVIYSLLQEPFKSVPLVWTVHEKTKYVSGSKMNDWKAIFNRATVVVFPNYALPMLYAAFDSGNYFVVPGSPCKSNAGVNMNIGFNVNDVVVGIVGSDFLYKGIWLEHALVLKALLPLLPKFPQLKIVIFTQDLTANYSVVIKEIASNLNYPKDVVKHVNDVGVLSIVDLVIYGSFLEEESFPDILIRAMCLEKPIIAPDLSIIKKHIDDGVNGHIFVKENIKDLTRIMLQLVSETSEARKIASAGKKSAKNMMALESIEGYASLMENILNLPSEVASPRAVSEIPCDLKREWQWHLFADVNKEHVLKEVGNDSLKEEEERSGVDDAFVYSLWEEERRNTVMKARKAREEDEVRDRSEQGRATWEEVYKNAKRSRNELHERDDGELERTGQPLCIYEPYFGEGSWPFLHHKPLYRGIGLSTKGRRPTRDDVDAPTRLPLLNTSYYRDTLSDFGAFLAIANRIDRIHKNAWIGFSSWRAKESLSNTGEIALVQDIESQKHGDAVYFWVRMDKDPRNPSQQDFWSFCDSINAGNCRFAFSEALKKMYGIRDDNSSVVVPPMPGSTWSVMNSWAMPTKSFLEFVMFSRMFIDGLDAHQTGFCYLSTLSKEKHCYSRVLELLVNVWAYHSARRMVYVNPHTGAMHEQHHFEKRARKMWIKWFDYNTLKAMDEDLAEEADSDHSPRRWLWPSTGEVFSRGIYEKERIQSRKDKETKKQKTRAKIQRIKNRTHQKVIGKYVKPPPENDTPIHS